MTKKLNIGIVGCAGIAKKYAIKAFQSLDTVGSIFIASRDKNKSEALAREFNIKVKDSYDSLITDQGIDAVYIPLPIGLHEQWAVKAASSGKHIICEKSLSHTLASAKMIVESCRKNAVVLFENFMCDYHPQHAEVLSLIHKKMIGNVFTFKGYFGFPDLRKDDIRYNKKLGGGSLNDVGAYPVFMTRKIFGSEPTSVTCHLDDDERLGVDIKGSAYFEFPENKIAFVAFGFDNVYQNNYSIWGNKGLISVDMAYSIPPDMKPSIELCRNENLKNVCESVYVPAANHFELIFNDFCNTILNDDCEKRKTKYNQIMKQAIALEAMRISAIRHEVVNVGAIQ